MIEKDIAYLEKLGLLKDPDLIVFIKITYFVVYWWNIEYDYFIRQGTKPGSRLYPPRYDFLEIKWSPESMSSLWKYFGAYPSSYDIWDIKMT